MFVTLVGLGCGTTDTMTTQGQRAISEADCLLGAKRLLEALPSNCTAARLSATKPHDLLEGILSSGAERPCVVYSGDTGFYSGTRSLLPLLEERGIPHKVLPGVSSVQLLSAQLGRPWQDWVLRSAHGVSCDPVSALMEGAGRPAFFLTGGTLGPADLCRRLTEAGLGGLTVTVGEALSYPQEKIRSGTAEEFSKLEFAPLSVLLCEGIDTPPRRTPGFPDEAFIRDKVPMTKQEVRAAVLGKLAPTPSHILWDVGAGTGSVSVELALAAPTGHVWAVERSSEGCALIRKNREKFRAWNLTLVEGTAPDALSNLPAPNGVFIGGSGGNMSAIVNVVLAKNPAARICVSAIALESLGAAVSALTDHGLTVEVSQISVSRTKKAGSLHLLTANNPVFLITGVQP